jgi:hypothetical protein
MGHSPLNDADAAKYVCERLIDLGKKLAAQTNTGRLDEKGIEGESFRTALRLNPDYEQDDGSFCAEVRLIRKGKGRHRARFVHLRRQRAGRRLDHPRPWRRLGGSHLSRRHHHRKLTYVELSRDIYWDPEVPREDLEAQVIIALGQLGLLPEQTSLEWLNRYLLQFRVDLGHGVTSMRERENARAVIRWQTAAHVLGRWSFPEDWRAFRKYVRNRIRFETREYVKDAQSIGSDIDSANDLSFISENARDTLAEKLSRHCSSPTSGRSLGTRGAVSVIEAAELLGLTKAYLYRLVHQGGIKVLAGKTLSIGHDELRRLVKIRGGQLERREEEKTLKESGKTESAARKAVYRKYGRGPHFAA